MDLLFKFYFSFFKTRIEQTAMGTTFALAIPLSLNIFTILIILLNMMIDLRKFGTFTIVAGAGLITYATGHLLWYRYVDMSRYKILLPIKYPFLNVFCGLVHWLFSVLSFITSLILTMSPQE